AGYPAVPHNCTAIRPWREELTSRPVGWASNSMSAQGAMVPLVRQELHEKSGRPESNRRRPAWEAFLALVGQGFFGGGSRNGITQYFSDALRFQQFDSALLLGPCEQDGPTASFRPARSSSGQEVDQMTSLRGKLAVVTGASSGVGKATVQALVAEGVRVTAVARGGDGLRALRAEAGPGVETVQADASDPAVADRLIRELGPDLVVLAAGVPARTGARP